MLRVLSIAALCAGALSLNGCAGTFGVAADGNPTINGQELNLGSASLNNQAASFITKVNAGVAIVQSDVPALCALASNMAQTGQLASALTKNNVVGDAAAAAMATATSPTCSGQPLSNLAALAQTVQATAKAASGK